MKLGSFSLCQKLQTWQNSNLTFNPTFADGAKQLALPLPPEEQNPGVEGAGCRISFQVAVVGEGPGNAQAQMKLAYLSVCLLANSTETCIVCDCGLFFS